MSINSIIGILGICFGVSFALIAGGIALAHLADWSIERRMRAWRKFNDNEEENK